MDLLSYSVTKTVHLKRNETASSFITWKFSNKRRSTTIFLINIYEIHLKKYSTSIYIYYDHVAHQTTLYKPVTSNIW